MEAATSIITVGIYELMLGLHTRADPARQEWVHHIDKMRAAKVRRGGDMKTFRNLVITDGGHPGSLERKEIFTDVLGGAEFRFRRGLDRAH